METEKVHEQPKKKLTLLSIGWLITFGVIPFGSCLPGLLTLWADHLIKLFKKTSTREITPSKPPLVIWAKRFMIFLIISTLLSGFFSPNRFIAIGWAVVFIFIFYTFIFASQKITQSPSFLTEHYLPTLFIASIIAFIISIFRYFIFHPDRAENLFTGSGGLGAIVVLVSGMIIGYLNWRGGKWHYLIIPYLGLAITALLLSWTRAAWAGFAAMLSCFAIFNRKLLPVILILILVLGIIFAAYPPLYIRLASIFDLSSNIDRILIAKATLKMIQDYPVFGVGAGVYAELFPKYDLPHPPGVPQEAHPFSHNIFLQFAADFGLVGLIFFCGLLGILIWMGFSLA